MSNWTLEITTEPEEEPVTLAEAKLHLRCDSADDDTYIRCLIAAARKSAEAYLHRALISTTYKIRYHSFPSAFLLPNGPIQSITDIKYTDTNEVVQTLASSTYETDIYSDPGVVVPVQGESWPTTAVVLNAVVLTYIAGYGNDGDDVPQSIQQAILMMVGHLYENRSDVIVGAAPFKMPNNSEWLLNPYRIVTL